MCDNITSETTNKYFRLGVKYMKRLEWWIASQNAYHANGNWATPQHHLVRNRVSNIMEQLNVSSYHRPQTAKEKKEEALMCSH